MMIHNLLTVNILEVYIYTYTGVDCNITYRCSYIVVLFFYLL